MHNGMTREQVFAELATRGVHTARVEFAGGGDEGDAEDSEQIEHSVRVCCDRNDSAGDGDSALSHALQDPIYERWGGFAGAFSVSGHCIWHVPDRKVELDYSESEYLAHTEVV